jgi:hypothetical protein
VGAQGAIASPGPSLEYTVKANYLYKFAPFVQWPPQAFAQPDSPFAICVAGVDPFERALDEAVRGQALNGRPVIIRRMPTVTPRAPCHVLFIGRLTGQTQEEAVKAVANEPVLTITEAGPLNAAGIIQLLVIGGRVRFDIDERAARAAGLNISSKLLSLAESHRMGAP